MKIKLSEFRKLVKSIIKEEVNNSLMEGETKVGNFSVDLEGGPANHTKRVQDANAAAKAKAEKEKRPYKPPFTEKWENMNAWDLFASPGTKVNAYTNGTVTEIKDSGNTNEKIYGVAITVKGSDGHPDAYYSHLTNTQVQVGSKVQFGTYIGDIAKWNAYPQWSHVHIALSSGSLKDYINKPKTFKDRINPLTLNVR